MTTNADQIARKCADSLWAFDTTSRSLGMQLDEVGPGTATFSMPVRDDMLNGHGTCHGGAIFSLADSAFGYASNTFDERSVAQHCTITYIEPARGGDILIARARAISRKGRSGIYDVTVSTSQGAVIAEFRGHSRTVGGPVIGSGVSDAS